MTNINTTSSSQLHRPNVAPDLTDLQFTETDLLNWFESRGYVRPNDGGSPYQWNIKTGTTIAAEIYTEGQGLPAPGTPRYTAASVAAFYARVIISNSGHERDQVRLRGVYQDPIAVGVDNALKMLRVLLDSTLAGSSANRGILSAVDSGDVYGGIDPAIVTNWASYEVNVGGALALAALNTMWRTMVDTPRGANPTDVLVSLLQFQRYTDLGGPAATGTQFPTRRDNADGLPFDLGMMRQMASFNGVPWTPIRSLATSELIMVDPADGFELREQRPLEVEKLARLNDDDVQQMSRALVLVIRNRYKQAKLTGLT